MKKLVAVAWSQTQGHSDTLACQHFHISDTLPELSFN